MKRFVLVVMSVFVTAVSHAACPRVGGVSDVNCDGVASVVVVGDSFVYGTGDTLNKGRGGYVVRARKKLRGVSLEGFGTKGLDTRQLLKRVGDEFSRTEVSPLREALVGSDIVVLDLGRNDRWFFGLPAEAYRNLKRIGTLIRSKVSAEAGSAPVVVTAVLMLPNRGSQGPWVKALNKLILKSDRPEAPADLRFDLVSKKLLSGDQLHPTSIGYDELAKTFVRYIQKTLSARLER